MQPLTSMLELNKLEMNVPFDIQRMEEWIEQNRKGENNVPNRYNYYSIIWVKKGKGIQLIDLDRFMIIDNSVYCISPGQVHLLSVDGPVEGYVISFTTDFIGTASECFTIVFKHGFFDTHGHSPVINPVEEIRPDMEEIVVKMFKEYKNFSLLRNELLRGLLKIFLIYLTRNFKEIKHEEVLFRNHEIVRNFFSLVDKYYTSKKLVGDYASELAVTPNYLNELVKRITGYPVSRHLQQRTVLEAKRMAYFSHLSMKEIAYRLGFEDAAHFSKYFKKASGKNFTDYRALLKKDEP